MSLGPWEIVLIFVVLLLVFGGKKLPELARGLGQGLKEFKKATKDIKEEINSAEEEVKEVTSDKEQ
tara:strand:- start:330 stop:527 length:198 start_codon:yes stop_codon:yes gene_type:complete